MKNRILMISVIAISLVMVSCEKSLDIQPKDSITDKGLTYTATEMEMYSNQFYTRLPGSLSWWAWASDGSSDNGVSAVYGYWDALPAGTQTIPSSGGGWDFTGVRSVNFFLANYKKSNEATDMQNKYAGEVYFWKAWIYADLLRRFGDLPWLTVPLDVDSPELYDGRISRSIIADSILAVLDKAIAMLPAKAQTAPGRIHKDVALLFKARIALYEGTWEKYHASDAFKGDGRDVNRFFTQARDAAEAVMNSGYRLYKEYADPALPEGFSYWRLFSAPSPETRSNPEVLLTREFNYALNLIYWGQQIITSGGPDGQGVSKSLVDAYLCKDGLPISVSPLYKGDDSLLAVVADRDPRLKMTVLTPGVPIKIYKGVTNYFKLPLLTLVPWPNTTGYQIYKWLSPFIATEDEGGNSTSNGVPIFRYAEALLIAAESHAELGTCTQQVLDRTINDLRDRAGVAPLSAGVGFTDPKWEFPQVSPLLNEIRRERRVELAYEGFRTDDLYRWAATNLLQAPKLGSKIEQWRGKPFSPAYNVDEVSKTMRNAAGYLSPYFAFYGEGVLKFNPAKDYLYPLPTDQLVLNTNLKQNPGY